MVEGSGSDNAAAQLPLSSSAHEMPQSQFGLLPDPAARIGPPPDSPEGSEGDSGNDSDEDAGEMEADAAGEGSDVVGSDAGVGYASSYSPL